MQSESNEETESNDGPTNPDATEPVDNNAALANAIVTAVNASRGPRMIKATEYLNTRSVHRDKPQLTRKVYQNGIMLSREQLSSDAIEMLNVLQPGVYANGVFQVVAAQDGTKMSALDILYANKSIDERMQIKGLFPTFEHMLAVMLKEREAVAAR